MCEELSRNNNIISDESFSYNPDTDTTTCRGRNRRKRSPAWLKKLEAAEAKLRERVHSK